jgi:hypothetical protein
LTVKLDGNTIKAKFFDTTKVRVEDVLPIRLNGKNVVLFDGATAKAI